MITEVLKKTWIWKYIRFILIRISYNRLEKTKPINDKLYLENYFQEKTGKQLDLDNPRTFNEKLIWLKINNKNELMTKCTDKILVREYVKECGLGHILNVNYGVWDTVDDIKFDELPADKVFFKCNHTSGDNRLYDRNRPFDYRDFRRHFNFMLKQNYYLLSREWNYKNIKPKIFAEKVFEQENLIDYRFFCFKGEVKLVLVDIDTCAKDGTHAPDAKRNIYDRNYKFLNFTIGRPNYDPSLAPKPLNYEKMIKYAEILSSPFQFVRVDFYNFDGEIFFGEMTFYPGGTIQQISDKNWDDRLGSWIDTHIKK